MAKKDKLTLTIDLKTYLPLIVIVMLALIAGWAMTPWMPKTMGIFLLFLAQFKLFDLEGFAKGFGEYDLITKKFPIYGYAYPFIEVALGLMYLEGTHVRLAACLTLIVMLSGAYSITIALSKKKKLNCACMGTLLKLPLGSISIVENVGMSVMAAMILL